MPNAASKYPARQATRVRTGADERGKKSDFLSVSIRGSFFDLPQSTGAAFTNRGIAFPFTDARRIVPAALALLALRHRDCNRNAFAFPSTAKLHLRHDEQIP